MPNNRFLPGNHLVSSNLVLPSNLLALFPSARNLRQYKTTFPFRLRPTRFRTLCKILMSPFMSRNMVRRRNVRRCRMVKALRAGLWRYSVWESSEEKIVKLFLTVSLFTFFVDCL